ncbi:hypothetical protein BDW22DRAFT_1361159 [Trametopsis cervina]|nr:hypothetical protein BDW22DRAFT_1361159 [Trametopsis cervina]
MRSRAHSIQGEAGTTYATVHHSKSFYSPNKTPLFRAFRALTGVGLPGPSDNDAWCLDEDRLVLTMGTETYQRFFKTGTAMPWKQHKDVHWFSFTLEELSKLSPKLRTAFKTWDERRGRWDVVYDYDGPGMSDSHEAGQVHIMQPTVRIMQHIYVPVVSITQRPSSADEREDWVDEMSALFEWVGMACLGSQRLQSHDNPDPYIAVYEAPPGSQTANVAHIQWRGFITLRVFEEIMGALAGYVPTAHFLSLRMMTILAIVILHLWLRSPDMDYFSRPS